METTASSIEESKAESGEMMKLPTECPASVNPSQSPASGRLVYVRRRVEVDTTSSKDTKKPKDGLVSSSTPAPSPSPQGPTSHRFDWEDRYHHLQMLLNKLNESDQTDHLQSKPEPKVSLFLFFFLIDILCDSDPFTVSALVTFVR
ncbi:unnamed protein product [Thlaspi arvense]|uniref:Uncharacterized protein n=1 Tax=Thlaspi arvense TaxID=13288 RepID=A0AAU9T2B3_THLAR|nr:unnamed protein product [Thlaspi arvense]